MSFIIEDKFINELKLKNNELLLYGIIYSYSKGSNGGCWASRKTLARSIGASIRTIDNTLTALIEKKLIYKSLINKDNLQVPIYSIVESTEVVDIRKKYERYLFTDFSSPAKQLYFTDVLFNYMGDNVCLTLKREIPYEWLKKLNQQNDFFNTQNKTGFVLKVIIE